MNTDRWYYRVFQGRPPADLGLDPSAPGDSLYRYELLRSRSSATASTASSGPVVLLLAAQTYRFLQQHSRVEHWAVLVITPHNLLKLGPTQALQLF